MGLVEVSITDRNSSIVCKIMEKGTLASHCTITRDSDKWNISSWYTTSSFKNKGYGKTAMIELFTYCTDKYGKPAEIKYTWNGQNSYVYDWMVKHFDAVCCCSLAVQKYSYDDDWESHLYDLNVDKFLNYLEIGE